VGVYVNRGKVIEVKKKIDTDNIINKAFIEKHKEIGEFRKSEKAEQSEPEQKNEHSDKSGKVNQGNIDYVVRQHDLKLKAIRINQAQIELEKKMAKVIPVDFSTEMFNIYLQSNIVGIISNGNLLIEKLIDEMKGSYELKLKYKKAFKSLVTETIKTNHGKISDEIINKARDYALQRNW
jgi:hypothetical protein